MSDVDLRASTRTTCWSDPGHNKKSFFRTNYDYTANLIVRTIT